MKKILFAIICILSTLNVNAESFTYQCTSYAIANVRNGNYTWGDWQSSNAQILVDTTEGYVYINTTLQQLYRIVSYKDPYNDANGGRSMDLKVIDVSDNTRGTISVRHEANGNMQLYVRFANVSWVYNIFQTN